MTSAKVEPLEPYPGSRMPWRCRCLVCGNEVSPMLHSIRIGQGGCRFCRKNAPIPPAVTEADMRAAGLEPLEPYPGALERWRCRCERCGNEVSPRLNAIRNGRGGCRFCGNQARGDARRVDEVEAVEDMRAVNVEPLEPYRGASAPWRCRRLSCGNEVWPQLSNIRSGHRPCRYCAEHGIDYTAPALVYLLFHSEYGAYKIGIAEQTSGRAQTFAAKGWEVLRTRPFATAADAFSVEQAVLAPYRATQLSPFLSRDDLPNGYTETIDAEAVSMLDLWAEIVAAAEELAGTD